MVIYNKKYMFDICPISSTEILKPLEFPKWFERPGVFCHVNEATVGMPPCHKKDGDWSLGKQIL